MGSTVLGLMVIYAAIWGMSISFLAAEDGELLEQLKDSTDSGAGSKSFISAACVVGVVLAAFMLLNRRRGTVMSIVEERMAIERDVLDIELEKRLAAERAELDAWKNEQIRQMYEVVLDQQARGLLPCPNCGDQHHGRGKRSA